MIQITVSFNLCAPQLHSVDNNTISFAAISSYHPSLDEALIKQIIFINLSLQSKILFTKFVHYGSGQSRTRSIKHHGVMTLRVGGSDTGVNLNQVFMRIRTWLEID